METGTGMSTTRAQHSFARIPQVEMQRSVFNRSCGLKTTFSAANLIPIFVDEALPGDTIQMNLTSFGRLATLIRPIMDNVYLDTFFFAVPNRLLWVNWKKFNGEQANPGDSTTFLVPQCSPPGGGWGELSLGDYFGIPTKIANLNVSALPLRAYNLIWNEWFRDQNLQTSIAVPTDGGPDAAASYNVMKRGKRHDYFTAALPFAQKGTAIALPLGATAPVKALTTEHTTTGTNPAIQLRRTDTNAFPGANTTASFGASGALGFDTGAQSTDATLYPTNLYADLATATAATINQIREAFQIQRLLERDARGGTRYTEIVRSHFGVISPDARQQRPEYLGGGTQRISINVVDSTNETATLALGEQAGTAVFGGQAATFRYSATEHCVIIGLACVRADLNYQQGLERQWSRRTRYDFYWPALSHLGEQSVLNKEIFAQGNATDDLTFGYQERHAEYRYKPSMITGRMRSNSATPLDSWHLAQNFGALPVLNASFIQEAPPMNRVIAVVTEPEVLADFYFNFKHARPMPTFGVPGLIDHF